MMIIREKKVKKEKKAVKEKKKAKKGKKRKMLVEGEWVTMEEVPFDVCIFADGRCRKIAEASYTRNGDKVRFERVILPVKKVGKKAFQIQYGEEELTLNDDSFVRMHQAVLTCAAVRSLTMRKALEGFCEKKSVNEELKRMRERFIGLRTQQLLRCGLKDEDAAKKLALARWQGILRKVHARERSKMKNCMFRVMGIKVDKEWIVKYNEDTEFYEIVGGGKIRKERLYL